MLYFLGLLGIGGLLLWFGTRSLSEAKQILVNSPTHQFSTGEIARFALGASMAVVGVILTTYALIFSLLSIGG